MPFDKSGKHHLNTQKMMAADKFPPKSPNMHKQSGEGAQGVGDPMGGKAETDIGGDSTRTTIMHNDDGSHSVMHHDGEETGPHDTIEDALDVINAKHGMTPRMQEKGEPAHHGMPMHGHAMMSGM